MLLLLLFPTLQNGVVRFETGLWVCIGVSTVVQPDVNGCQTGLNGFQMPDVNRLSCVATSYHGLPQVVTGYHGLPWVAKGCHGLSPG